MQTPAFVDRMDVADDADGRVSVFSVEVGGPALRDDEPTTPGGIHAVLDRIGGWLDAPYAVVGIALGLVVVLALGLALLRR